MGFKFNQEFRYRMPTVFGPAVGPRQKPGGGMWALEETGTMNAEWMAITYRTSADKLEALLPPGMSLRGEPLISVSCAWFKNLYWLAGRGYGILSIDFPVTYQGKTERLEGSFCPVIWEGAPDAILTGRDEMGFPKLFCDMPEITWDKEKPRHPAKHPGSALNFSTSLSVKWKRMTPRQACLVPGRCCHVL